MHTCISWMYKSTNCTLHYTQADKTHAHTHTRHTSRLSLCFQLRGGPRGNQNFDTPGWKRRAEKPGTARGVHVHTDVRAHLQARTQIQPQLSSRRQAKVYGECKNMTLRGGEKLRSSVRSRVFFLHLPRGRQEWMWGVGEMLWPDCFLLYYEIINWRL